jgi:multiple antibiotic resistance protein
MVNVFSLISWFLILQLFVLIDPLTSFSVLMSAHKKKMNVRQIAVSAVIVALVIVIIIVILGKSLFNLFGITLDSFRIAGGIVLLLLGLETIRSKEQESKDIGTVDSLISILATPLLTGPAVISFIIIKTYELGQVALLVNLFITFLIVGTVFIMFSFFINKINMKFIDILSRILGLFLTAIAIEMISIGIRNMFMAVT